MDFDKMLADAKLPETVVKVCLRGNLAVEHARLDDLIREKLQERERSGATSLAGDGLAELREQLLAIEAEMKEHTYPFLLRSLGRNGWRRLMDAHPPRQEQEGSVSEAVATQDAISGINRDTFFEPMLRASIVDPVLSDEQWTQLVEKLTDRQYEDLVNAAWDLNQGKVSVPFSLAASLGHRSTDSE
jgi:hypothetical protein